MVHHSICSDFLTRLGVPHTECFTDRRFEESPYAGTLLGMRDLLSEYNVASKLERFDNKEDVFGRKAPFIAMIFGKLVVVTRITEKDVTIVAAGTEQTLSRDDFLKKWNGKAIFAVPDKESCEPSLKHHRQLQAVIAARRWGIPLCAAVIFVLLFIDNGLYRNVGM